MVGGLGPQKELRARAERYDRLVADALVTACGGDVAGAVARLDDIKADIVDERTSRAKSDYVVFASIAGLAVLAASFVLLQFAADLFPSVYPIALDCVVYGACAGAVGALFSIAIGIRGRTILTDLHALSNRSDAILRMFIGATAGALLACILSAKLASFSLGGQDISLVIAACDPTTPVPKAIGDAVRACTHAQEPLTWWMRLVVLGVAAGFSERIVPDLLGKATTAAADQATKDGPKPLPQSPGKQPPPAPQAGQPPHPAGEGADDTDSCLTGRPVTAAETTEDSALPASTGG